MLLSLPNLLNLEKYKIEEERDQYEYLSDWSKKLFSEDYNPLLEKRILNEVYNSKDLFGEGFYLNQFELREDNYHVDDQQFIDLGVYTIHEAASDFLLEEKSIIINAGESKKFVFKFLLRKELLRKFKQLNFGYSSELSGYSGEFEPYILDNATYEEEEIDMNFINTIDLKVNFLFTDYGKKGNYLFTKSWKHIE